MKIISQQLLFPFSERGWWRDAKDTHKEREIKTYETRQKDEKPQTKGDDNGDWHHDRFFEMEADLPPPPKKKRPAFSEKKILATTQSIKYWQHDKRA